MNDRSRCFTDISVSRCLIPSGLSSYHLAPMSRDVLADDIVIEISRGLDWNAAFLISACIWICILGGYVSNFVAEGIVMG